MADERGADDKGAQESSRPTAREWLGAADGLAPYPASQRVGSLAIPDRRALASGASLRLARQPLAPIGIMSRKRYQNKTSP